MTTQPCTLTYPNGAPVGDMKGSLTVGPRGPVMLDDHLLVGTLADFNRQKPPERIVHAKGGGARGIFTVTADCSTFTKAAFLSSVGKQTEVTIRFSTTAGEMGSADTLRDIHGMAMKFYTEQGNFDMLCVNFPVFPVNDGMKFAALNQATRRHPKTHVVDVNAVWDFFSLCPESALAVVHLFADPGTPDGFRYMETYPCHAFKFVNAAGELMYGKFQITPDLNERFLTTERATELAGTNPDYAIEDLYNAIESGDFPSWGVDVQMMTQEEADQLDFYVSDVCLEWPKDKFPLRRIGTITLNRNPENYFNEVEQVCFAPNNLVPGIEAPPDRLFHARSFAYNDAQRYRVGVNFTDLEVNRPKVKVANYDQNGMMCCHYQVGPINYYPNTTGGPQPDPTYKETVYNACGDVDRYGNLSTDYFSQPRAFYQEMEEDHKERFVENLATSISGTRPEIRNQALTYLSKIDPDLAARVAAAITVLTP